MRIYIYNQDSEEIKVIESASTILGIFNVKNTVYYQEVDKEIFKIEKGISKLVTDFSVADNDKIELYLILRREL